MFYKVVDVVAVAVFIRRIEVVAKILSAKLHVWKLT